jgi:hypothetical protein
MGFAALVDAPAVDANLTAMQFDQRPHQRQSDAEASGRGRPLRGICVNNSKMRGMASEAMPMPVSCTTISARPRARAS